MTKTLVIFFMVLLSGCAKAWEPIALADGYRIMEMNSKEVYVADSSNELVVGPTIESIGLAPGFIIVNCGTEERVVNGFANTVGFNLIDTKTGTVTKRLTKEQAVAELRTRGVNFPDMRPFASFVQ
jgi:RHS repeat-associated protein